MRWFKEKNVRIFKNSRLEIVIVKIKQIFTVEAICMLSQKQQ